MFLTFTVLAFLLGNIAFSDALPTEAKSALKEINIFYNRKLVWSDKLENSALKYLKSPGSVKASMVIRGEKAFPNKNSYSLGKKVLDAFVKSFKENEIKVRFGLPARTKYGCNIILKTTSMNQVVDGVCLYKIK